MALLQNEIRGTPEDKRRRKGILKTKAYGLAIDLAGVFIINVLLYASVVVFRSTFSSGQFVVHYAVLLSLNVVAIYPVVINMYAGIKKRKRSLAASHSVRGKKETRQMIT